MKEINRKLQYITETLHTLSDICLDHSKASVELAKEMKIINQELYRLKPENKETDLWWWGYLHCDNSIHLKRYLYDISNNAEVIDCVFVKRIILPFKAANQEIATAYVIQNAKDLID